MILDDVDMVWVNLSAAACAGVDGCCTPGRCRPDRRVGEAPGA
jgi:hypothetical protein